MGGHTSDREESPSNDADTWNDRCFIVQPQFVYGFMVHTGEYSVATHLAIKRRQNKEADWGGHLHHTFLMLVRRALLFYQWVWGQVPMGLGPGTCFPSVT